MSKASNLAGFVPSIEPTNNLTVGNIVGTSATFTGQLIVSGVSTFQNHVNLLDDDRLYFGADQDFFIGHQTIPSPINYISGQNSVPLSIFSDNLTLGALNGENFAAFITNGSASLYYDNSKKFETAGAGVTVTGTTFTDQLIVSGVSTVTGLSGVAYAGITSTAVSKTLINREYCTVVAAGVTITLPATPSPGWEVGIAVDNFTDVVVARNGSNIMALNEDFTMDIAYLALQFVYVDSVQGWRYF